MLEKKTVEELKSRVQEAFDEHYELAGGKNYRFHHLVRCHRHVRKLIKSDRLDGCDIDEEVAETAALFHDIGRKEDIEEGYMNPIAESGEHAPRGGRIVSQFIEDVLPPEKVEKVEKIIENHHSSPETVEGKVVQDCDALSNFGVNNLWRMIHYSADKERTLEQSIDYFWNQLMEQYTERLENFHFDITKRAAKKRITKHQEAMNQIEDEIFAEDL
ncbi:MAG: HD domain-containing protein [Candidatus Nanohalobium sp.]